MALFETEVSKTPIQFWLPFVITVILTPFFLFIGAMSGGAGHGSYLYAKILFPYTMLSTIVFEAISPAFIIVAILQYPIYGLILGKFNKSGGMIRALIVITIVHFLTVALCLNIIGNSFS